MFRQLGRYLEIEHQPVPIDYREALHHQRQRDLAGRQKPGVVFYPTVFLIIFCTILLDSPTQTKLLWLVIFGILISGLSLLRYHIVKRYIGFLSHGIEAKELPLFLSLFFSATAWGCLFMTSFIDCPLHEHFPLILTATIALCAGSVISLSIRKIMVAILIVGMVGPGILVSISGYSLFHPGLGAVLLVFGIGMGVISNIPRYEYENSVINHLKLSEQAKYLSELTTIDPLTQVRNRRFFDQLLPMELSRANRVKYPLSLLLVDIDHFKQINDTYGHLIGDHCLVNTAKAMQKHLQRSTDIIARYGGEEFGIVLPGVEQNEAEVLAEQLRSEVAKTVTWSLQTPINLTISIGGATAQPDRVRDPKRLLEQVDNALYAAKQAGRNRVVWSILTDNDKAEKKS